MSTIIRAMATADLEGFRAVARDAGLVAAIDHIGQYLAWQPDGYLVAEGGDGRVVGAVGALRFGTVAFIGAMCVSPSLQGQGLGRHLMETLLQQLGGHGIITSLLEATDAGAPLYARLGFETVGTTRVFSGEGRPLKAPPSSVRPFSPRDLADVLAFDTARFGASRRVMLEDWFRTHGDRSFVSRRTDGALTGFITMARSLGPWLADDATSAEDLLDAALAVHPQGAFRAYCAGSNAWACALLESRGMAMTRTMRRMRLGPAVHGVAGSILALVTAGAG